MKKIILLLTILITLGCTNKLTKNQLIANEENNYDNYSSGDTIRGQYIIIMKESFEVPLSKQLIYPISDTNRIGEKLISDSLRGQAEQKLKHFLDDHHVSYNSRFLFVDIAVGGVVHMNPAKAKEIKEDENVEDVIPDVVTQTKPIQQTDPDVNTKPIQQWMSPPIPDTKPIQQNDSIQNRYDIDTVKHWTKALIIAGGPVSGVGKSAFIWFLDTGIDPSPYLDVRWALAKTFYGTSAEDNYGHGTFCAGVAAGTPITVGAAGGDEIHYGVSEGAPVVPVKVLDGTGKGNWGTVIMGLNHVVQYSRPGDIVNMSLGAYDSRNTTCPFPPAIVIPIRNIIAKGVYVTLSAGNDAGDAVYNTPGCTNGTNIFTVSSINADRTCASYANFGLPVDFVTVGTRVFSLWDNGNFIMATGTSASSALLAGIIHASNGIPASGSSVSCDGSNYIIAVRR